MNYIDKIKKLPENVRTFLSSAEPMIEIKKSLAMFDVAPEKSWKIAKEIGLMYVGDESLKNLPKIIQKNLSLNENLSTSIAYEINKRIFFIFPTVYNESLEMQINWNEKKLTPTKSESSALEVVFQKEPWIKEELKKETLTDSKSIIQLTIKEIFKKYPETRKQPIGRNNLFSKEKQREVPPSIENWIEDYVSNLGYRAHNSLERGEYLFHSLNPRKLESSDRNNLSQLLKSFDEGTPLLVDKDNKKIIFQKEFKPASRTVWQKTSPIKNIPSFGNVQNTSFNFHQKLPFESKKTNQKLPAPHNMLLSEKKTLPKNIINLKDLN